MFEGSFVALVTPFRDGSVDLAKVEALTRLHLDKGTNGIVPCGTTGEAAALTSNERAQVIRAVLKVAKGKVPVIPGTGTNNTQVTIEFTKMARELGADGALLVTPYYNKPPQEGLYRHFEAVAKAVDIPQIMYNVPSRTAVNLKPETVARLSKLKNIVAIKDASGSVEQITQTLALCDICVFSGDDAMTLPILRLGGKGVISVAANIVPDKVAELCRLQSQEVHDRYHPLFQGLFLETNPIPVKTAMEMMGLIQAEVRLPLCPMSDGGREQLHTLLRSYELVE